MTSEGNFGRKAAHAPGLHASLIALDARIEETRGTLAKALRGRSPAVAVGLSGYFSGLVTARALLALAEYPEQPENAALIKKLLSQKK